MSSAHKLHDIIKTITELKKALNEPLRLFEFVKSEITKPLEEEFRKTIGDVIYDWITDLGVAKEFKQVNPEELYKRVKEHFKT